jgi:hypothetical protein
MFSIEAIERLSMASQPEAQLWLKAMWRAISEGDYTAARFHFRNAERAAEARAVAAAVAA